MNAKGPTCENYLNPCLLFFLYCTYSLNFGAMLYNMGFPGGSDGKESSCNVGDLGSISGLGRSPEEGMATHSSILAWTIPWREEPGGLQSMGLKELDMTK